MVETPEENKLNKKNKKVRRSFRDNTMGVSPQWLCMV